MKKKLRSSALRWQSIGIVDEIGAGQKFQIKRNKTRWKAASPLNDVYVMGRLWRQVPETRAGLCTFNTKSFIVNTLKSFSFSSIAI